MLVGLTSPYQHGEHEGWLAAERLSGLDSRWNILRFVDISLLRCNSRRTVCNACCIRDLRMGSHRRGDMRHSMFVLFLTSRLMIREDRRASKKAVRSVFVCCSYYSSPTSNTMHLRPSLLLLVALGLQPRLSSSSCGNVTSGCLARALGITEITCTLTG